MEEQAPYVLFEDQRDPYEYDLDGKIAWGRDLIDEAIDQYGENLVGHFAALSGGDDSLICTHLVMEYLDDAEVYHANTGVGLEETRRFVRGTCDMMGWPLQEIHAEEDCGESYEEMVLENGFPGSPSHRYYKDRLKMRAAHYLRLKTIGKKYTSKKVAYYSGIRWDESDRRKSYSRSVIDVKNNQVWVNPIYWFSERDLEKYRKRFFLPRNPASELMGHSGECLCGANADGMEWTMIRRYFPSTYMELKRLRDRLAEENPDKACEWWGSPDKETECPLFDEPAPDEDTPMCYGCGKSS